MCLRGGVERPPDRAAAGPRDTRLRIDLDLSEPREIDDQAAVADGMAGDVVPAASDGDRQLVLARAIASAIATSSVLRQRAIASGRRSISALKVARARS